MNTGHGHVHPRPDGVKARCGGPGLCVPCSMEAALLERATVTAPAAATAPGISTVPPQVSGVVVCGKCGSPVVFSSVTAP